METPTLSGAENPPVSENKRRRVTRACDHCRLKKVKCDGRQPCIHCTVYSYSCTYDRPMLRNKNASGPLPSVPQSTAVLQLIAMHKQPSMFTINNNLVLSQNILNSLFPSLHFNFLDDNSEEFDFKRFQRIISSLQARNPGGFNINEITERYTGESAHETTPTNSSVADEYIGAELKIVLPSKEKALQLVYTTWNKACVLFRFYHRPSLLEEVDLLYSLDPLQYTDRQQKFLPFMYSLLACGSLFSKNSANETGDNVALEDDGYKYFLEARKLIDISNVSDIPAIQTIVMLTIYLQCSARLSTCYSYIGIALRSALKEGLHRDLGVFQSKRKLDPIETDTRKRLFYTIYKMDIYINSLLGLPGSINEDEFDQEFPLELDDELITRDAFLLDQQNGRLSSSACANHHTKLTMLLSRIVKELYPIKVKPKLNSPKPNIHDIVTELEFELKKWADNVPPELRPSDPSMPDSDAHIPEKFKLANYYLHIAFLNCQMSLYRPFIHCISNGYLAKTADPRSLIRGRNCIKVARLVVKLANKMIDQNLLVGTYWFSMYTIFFSIACLVYYFHFANYNNQDKPFVGVNYAGVYFDDDLNIEMIRKDIDIGKKVLDNMKNMSTASLRIYNILNKLFEQLNRKTATSSMNNNVSRDNTPFCNDAMVKLSIANFDKINEFRAPKHEDPQYADLRLIDPYHSNAVTPEVFNQFVSSPNRAALLSGVEAAADAGAPKFDAGNGNTMSHGDREPGTDLFDNQPEDAEMLSAMHNGLDYVPGLVDEFDAQIFGRLLPPYMLENARDPGAFDSEGEPEKLAG